MIKTLHIHLTDMLEYRRTLNYSPRTLQDMRDNLTTFLQWLHSTCAVTTPDQLRKDHLRAWHKHLLERKNAYGFPITPGTINGRIGQVRSFLKYLVERGHVLKNLIHVLQSVKAPKLLPRSVLTHAQVRKLLNSIDTSTRYGFRDRAIFELLYSSGLRVTEALSLDVGSINFDHRTILVKGKGNKERVVPIGKTALRFLKSYVLGVRAFFLHEHTEQALFLDRYGKRYQYHNLQQVIRRYSRHMNFEFPVTAHTFRRSCTTEMIRGGANIYHVKEFLGHESLDTLRHYTRLTIKDLQITHQKCHPREQDEPR